MNTNQPSPDGNVRELSTLQQRHQLEHLLEIRSELAVTAIEQLSHSVQEARESFQRLVAVEGTIEDLFPDTYPVVRPRWVLEDARRLHSPGALVGRCSLCQDLAAVKGIDHEGPEAA